MKKVKVSLLPIANGINLPTVIKTVVAYGEKIESIFAATQTGEIYKFTNQTKEKYIDISEKIIQLGSNGGYDERGLLGLAFHPRHSNNGLFYLHYTKSNIQGPGALDREYIPNPCDKSTLYLKWENRDTLYDHIDTIEEWKVNSNGSKSLIRTILNIKRPFMNHNGVNSLNFCPETNKLIFTVGDGGSGYDPFNLAQDNLEIAGKAISIDVDKKIFVDNPPAVTRFDELPRPLQEIMEVCVKGIRNTAGIAFSKQNNNYIKYIGSVGQELVEAIYSFDNYVKTPVTNLVDKINIGDNIVNLGWRAWEGNFPTSIIRECENNSNKFKLEIAFYQEAVNLSSKYIYPLTYYFHFDKREDRFEGNALTGLQVYKGDNILELKDKVIFTDFINSKSDRGILAYTNPRKTYMLNDYSEIIIDYDFEYENTFYTCLGVNMDQTKLYLGVYGSASVSDLNQGSIFEIIPK